MKRRATIGAVVIALALSGCGGDNEGATSPPAPSVSPEAPAETTPNPNALPPAFLECLADRGYELLPTDDIHAAPPEILQTCFESLHEGG
jgi:hypothetical protein